MELTDTFNGENSDFEDDVVEIDFEEQFEKEEEQVADNREIGIFGIGVEPEEEEEEHYFPDEEEATQADITEVEEPYQDGLTAEDVVPKKELEGYSDANEEEYYGNKNYAKDV